MEPQLDEKFKTIALNELREDDARKKHALEQFREWIAKQGHIKNCRTDDQFLLQFLRTKKYSLTKAYRQLELFILKSQLFPQWFKNLNFDDNAMKLREIYDSGYFFPCPERDANGCRVIMLIARNFDALKFTYANSVQLATFVAFACMEEEETQISGLVYILDYKDLTFEYFKMITPIDIKNHLQCVTNSIPGRQKMGLFINLPNYAAKAFEAMKTFASKKLQDRAFFYADESSLANHVDISILPKEYGGKIPMKEMIDEFRKTLIERTPKLKEIEAMSIDEDYLKANATSQEELGSFRKLEID